MNKDSKNLLIRVFLDIVTVCAIGLASLAFYGYTKPIKLGYFCHGYGDTLHPDHGSTVTSAMLYSIGTVLPVSLIFINEFVRYFGTRTLSKRISCCWIPGWVVEFFLETYKIVGVFVFGVSCCLLLCSVAHYTIGRLRPDFFHFCRSAWINLGDCSNPDIPKNHYEYYYKCDPSSYLDPRMMELGKSFPSGQSCFAMYAMLYGVIYIQARMHCQWSTLLKHGIQLVMIILGVYTSLSIVSDYTHNWWDVLAGAGIGSTVAVVMAKWGAKLFDEEPKSDSVVELKPLSL